VLATVCLVISGVLLPIGLLAGWANTTFYDSATFSQRAVDLLDSQAVRRELADRLTQQLALNGNQQAVNFRPAFELAIQSAVDTDTFRSIFRDAIRRAHETVLGGRQSGTALDLSDSLAIISGTLQLPDTAQPGQRDEQALGTSLTDVTDRLAGLGLWRLEGITADLFAGGVGGAIVAAAAAIALATDRRRMVARLGFAVLAGGLLISGLVLAAEWYVGRVISDQALAAAVRGAVSHGMADLSSVGLWTAAYGVIIAAAARAEGDRRLTPAGVASSVSAWAERRRTTTGGTVALGAAAIVAGLVLIASPSFWLTAALVGAGLWLAYFGVAELIGLVRARVPAAAPASGEVAGPGRRRTALVAGLTAGILVVVGAGGFAFARGAADRANAAGVQKCNGDESLCDLPLNLAAFPGTHNSMSAALYPGWLFAEQVRTIGGQLNEGVRALLIDTHYGVQSAARMPGSETPVILTDRAAELQSPVGGEEDIDPAVAQRAADLASRTSPRADAKRELYLCHNYCEMGAVRFADALGEIKTFLDSHPDDVVMTIIQDATTPADTAAAIEQAGLGERVYTLDPNKPLPTLGEMIRSRRTLLVFAENGGDGAPPWYQEAYEQWFQETPYAFSDVSEMNCGPNRGPPNAPLFLVNHWVSASPPDPKRAGAANSAKVIEERLRRCLAERGLLANVIAVDFASRGDLFDTVAELNQTLLDQVRSARGGSRAPPPEGSTPSTEPSSDTPVASGGPVIQPPTPIGGLTGGDPSAFCERAPALLDVAGAWALANVVAPVAQKGLSDFAFAPAAARVMAALDGVAPVELARQLVPATDRARAAVQALRDLGIDQATIDAVAEQTQSQLSGINQLDPVAVESAALDRFRAAVGAERLNGAANAFAAANPEVPGLFDFGEVPDDVARNAGYNCLVGPAG
jgi:hypothetical protein